MSVTIKLDASYNWLFIKQWCPLTHLIYPLLTIFVIFYLILEYICIHLVKLHYHILVWDDNKLSVLFQNVFLIIYWYTVHVYQWFSLQRQHACVSTFLCKNRSSKKCTVDYDYFETSFIQVDCIQCWIIDIGLFVPE